MSIFKQLPKELNLWLLDKSMGANIVFIQAHNAWRSIVLFDKVTPAWEFLPEEFELTIRELEIDDVRVFQMPLGNIDEVRLSQYWSMDCALGYTALMHDELDAVIMPQVVFNNETKYLGVDVSAIKVVSIPLSTI